MKTILFLILIFGVISLSPEQNDEIKSKVYFSKEISPEILVTMYKKLGIKLTGNVALKVHSGEPDGPYFLRPSFLKKIYDYIGIGTFVETNTGYLSGRGSTEKHKQTAEKNGWIGGDIKFQILDENPEENYNLAVAKPVEIKTNIVGGHTKEYNSCLVLSHFKGHQMGGFGGALKQLSIGFASREGKANIHTAGITTNATEMWSKVAPQLNFTNAMADAASSIVDFFKRQDNGGIAYINVLVNISIMCDCTGKSASAPEIKDIGVLASLDPVAIDYASLDLVKNSTECDGKQKWLKQVQDLLGENTIFVAEKIGMGNTKYELIEVKEEDKDDDKKDGASFINLGLYLLFVISYLII